MTKHRQKIFQFIGIAGTAACIGLFLWEPSFPTPDKLLVFLFFVFLGLEQATEMLKRFLPFVAILLAYESFRGIADSLNTHVNYLLGPHVDNFLFGNLPTAYLQNLLWHGHVQWYDYALYLPYLLFFVLPIGMATLVWKTREKYYWQFIATYVALFFAAFLTFLLMPSAPPWLASQLHYIQHIERISSHVWAGLGLHNFPSLYQHISPNPVAAIPSLHAASAVLLSLFIFKLYGRRWGLVSLAYPLVLCFGIVYEGEHYVFDVMAGITYAVAAFYLVPYAMKRIKLRNKTNHARH